MEFSIVAWDKDAACYFVRNDEGSPEWYGTPEGAIAAASGVSNQIRCDQNMPIERLIPLIAAATFCNRSIYDLDGKIIQGTPVPDAQVHYITRAEIGAVLPDGWFIEVQLNRYSAMWGEQMTLPARKTLAAAISDIQTFLAMSVAQANQDLLESVKSQAALAEGEQLTMWPSSDSA